MTANEIRKDTFIYRDTFFADPGGDKRHPRASIAELKDLLLPKKGCVPAKDQVAHWYEAQLLHYGLPRSKDKNTAKVRLTSAIAAGNLTVPVSIIQMEADMKKEFAAANRKAKAVMKAKEAESPKEPTSKSKKRKANFNGDSALSATTTKISVKPGNVTLDIDHHEGGPQAKKQKATPQATKAKAAKVASKPETKTPKVPKKSTTTDKPPKTVAISKTTQSPIKAADSRKPKQTARRTGGPPSGLPSTSSKAKNSKTPRPVGTSPDIPVPIEDEHELSDSDHQHDTDVEMYDAPPHYESDDNNHRDGIPIQISGIYVITTPFDDMKCELTLVKDTRTGQFWGHFIAADHRGVIHIPRVDGLVTRKVVDFNWRAADEGSGHLHFRRDQNGWIQFDGQGGVKGCWNGLLYGEDIEFMGGLAEEPDIEVEQLMNQWEWFVKSAYGR